jgi:diguanylate cyclase (GGDEF)-like protein
MRKLTPPNVLIVSSAAKTRERWTSLLQSRSQNVWEDCNQVPADLVVELVLTDTADIEQRLQTQAAKVWEQQPGIVVCGDLSAMASIDSPRVDACLNGDVDSEQLLLVCELVAEIARLRRRCRQGGRQRRLLGHLAMTDPLTGLPNRWAWEEEIRRRTEVARQSSLPLCLALVDLDEFKEVNDTLGHARGDAVLRSAAHELVSQLRQEDFVARLGGDEFGLLLFADSEPTAATVVERVRAAITVEAANDQWLTASAGMAIYRPATAGDFANAYNAADRALQQAKQEGRNRLVATSMAAVRDAAAPSAVIASEPQQTIIRSG